MIISIRWSISHLSAGKKSTSFFTFSLRHFFITKILWICFGYFGNARQCSPKVILLIYRKLSCLSSGKKLTSSSMLFWRLNVRILGTVSTREPEFFQIRDWGWNINNNISFHFTLFPRKANDKIFQKIKKKKYFAANLGPFAEVWSKLLSLEKRTLPVFKYSNYFFHNIEIFNSQD